MKTSRVAQGFDYKFKDLYLTSNLNTTSLRRLGNTTNRTYRVYPISSFPPRKTSHFTTSSLRRPNLRASYVSRLCSSFLRFGARPISHLGIRQSPSKQLCVSKRTQLSNQDPYKQPIFPRKLLRSSFGSWTAVIIACAAAILYSVSPGADKHQSTPVEILEDIEQEISNMTGEALPGRPGTLTPEQEEIEGVLDCYTRSVWSVGFEGSAREWTCGYWQWQSKS